MSTRDLKHLGSSLQSCIVFPWSLSADSNSVTSASTMNCFESGDFIIVTNDQELCRETQASGNWIRGPCSMFTSIDWSLILSRGAKYPIGEDIIKIWQWSGASSKVTYPLRNHTLSRCIQTLQFMRFRPSKLVDTRSPISRRKVFQRRNLWYHPNGRTIYKYLAECLLQRPLRCTAHEAPDCRD